MKPAKTPRVPGEPPPKYQVGDWVYLLGIYKDMPALITEDRGCLGVGGSRLYQIRIDPDYGVPIVFEMPEDELVPVPEDKRPTKPRIQKVGDHLLLPIPPHIAAQLGFTDGSEVEVAIQLGRLVVYPPGKRPYTLEEALEHMTDDQLHGEIDLGPPVGRELI
jgi:antitoxin MazE